MTHVMDRRSPTAPTRHTGDALRFLARGLGQLLITAGVVVLLFVGYELWGTNYYTRAQQHKLDVQIAEQWRHGGVPDISQQTIADVPLGSGIAVLRIPRFGHNYHMVIVQGTTYEDLKKGPGHWTASALPGQVGNFYVAGHRTTYLAPFNHIDKLRAGDAIVLETKDWWFTYTVEDAPAAPGYPKVPWKEIVLPTALDISYPVPDQPDPSLKPSLRLLTFSSCNPKYSAAQRYIIHAVLTQKLRKSDGVIPPALES